MTKEEAWSAFAEQYNHRLHGPSDAFKFAWDAATKAEHKEVERLQALCQEMLSELYVYRASEYLKDVTEAIKARNKL